jgi:hypothetical protein
MLGETAFGGESCLTSVVSCFPLAEPVRQSGTNVDSIRVLVTVKLVPIHQFPFQQEVSDGF